MVSVFHLNFLGEKINRDAVANSVDDCNARVYVFVNFIFDFC